MAIYKKKKVHQSISKSPLAIYKESASQALPAASEAFPAASKALPASSEALTNPYIDVANIILYKTATPSLID